MDQQNIADRRENTLVVPDSPFGIVRGFLYGHMGAKADVFMPQVHQLGAGLVRLFLFWSQVEPERGRFVWDAIDTFLEQLEPTDDAWITLNSSSLWGTRQSTNFQPPSPALRLDEYYHFVFRLVSHCRGRVRYWQCDNEPTNPLLWAGTAQEYANQLKVFARAVKDADLGAVVVLAGAVDAFHTQGPDTQVEQEFFDYLLRESVNDFDVFDLHLYGDLYAIPANIKAVRQKMAALGYHKPIYVGEYNGPSFFNFAENLPILQRIFERMGTSPQGEALAQATQSEMVATLYQQMADLPAQAQMFMEGCPPELEQKRHRINCRELVTRSLLALSEGVQKMLCWNLANEKVDRYNLMHLLFDKHKFLDYEKGVFKEPYPAAGTFRRMVHMLAGIEQVQRIEIPERPAIYLFEVRRRERGPLLVVWERRDTFGGEENPAVSFEWPWSTSKAQAIDVFGEAVSIQVD
ncbi:MAG: hypothetical protein J2P36_33375, partial [Ktedonobacteraceae bacterium]|nr:hypothetical protein [Ktedonobacteraceae bacterium]